MIRPTRAATFAFNIDSLILSFGTPASLLLRRGERPSNGDFQMKRLGRRSKAMDKDLAIRAARDALYAQLAVLDRLGEIEAAVEINAGIEILNKRLGEAVTPDELDQLAHRFLSD